MRGYNAFCSREVLHDLCNRASRNLSEADRRGGVNILKSNPKAFFDAVYCLKSQIFFSFEYFAHVLR